MHLTHLHFPHPIPYALASRLQTHLVSLFLASKASPSTSPPPPPTIITAEFHPVYTTGRRELNSLSPAQEKHLRTDGRATLVRALRGGQTTFHGPGQLVAYPILDLRAHALTPRNYVCLLEKSVIGTCAAYGVRAMTTEHTGVWTSPEDKICAVGVHMRRNVTSHGVALNVGTDTWWFERIVACGLEGKRTTTLEREGVRGVGVGDVAGVLVGEVAGRLGSVEGVVKRDAVEFMREEGIEGGEGEEVD